MSGTIGVEGKILWDSYNSNCALWVRILGN